MKQKLTKRQKTIISLLEAVSMISLLSGNRKGNIVLKDGCEKLGIEGKNIKELYQLLEKEF